MAPYIAGVDPVGDDVELDEGVMEALPAGCRVLNTAKGGESLWVETLRIAVELPDGTEQVFFKKGAPGPVGFNMMKGSFESEKALYSFIPEYVPEPVAYGSYRLRPDMHFYMAEYIEMKDDGHPDPRAWAEVFSTLHKRSMGKSPEGKFGFHMNTHLANIPQDNTWNSSWEKFWAQIFRSLCEKEEAARGPDDDLTRVKKASLEIVVPRYLRPLESDGRVVHPTLLHNNGWPGNIKPRTDSSQTLCLFDSCVVWGHSEADIRVTRPNTWNLEAAGEMYRDTMGVSEPRADFDARIEVYATLGLVLRSAMYPQEPARRLLFIEQMEKLIDLTMTSGAMRRLPAPLTAQSVSAQNIQDDVEEASKTTVSS
ncbi:Fructosamine kinase domain containing protein [Rhypophila sp. PSN 637]